ncbi:hypothetical protein [Faecalibacter sp. LW9]|uniref:hypothetical protein n=1 Tax=Faecalibacter sp. LW9 TaxID=3103144 RepID=UPI002AFE8656|nr:hypothetical protein [Faecalibacter sp. LW9]
MRFYAGISILILSLLLLLFTIFFFDFTILFEKLIAASFFIFAAVLFLYAIKVLSIYYDYKRVMKSGIKAKAKIIHVSRALEEFRDAPDYILEVIYEHPLTHSKYKTIVDAMDWNKLKNSPKVNENIEVIIDPHDPTIALYFQ